LLRSGLRLRCARLFLSAVDGCIFFFQAEDGIRDFHVTGVQTCALPILAAAPLESKVRNVIAPLAESLRTGGRLIGIHSTGRDPGMEIIRQVWPDEDPFRHGGKDIVDELRRQVDDPELEVVPQSDDEAAFRFEMHYLPSEDAEHIGTSSLLATWNAATYVAQIDERRLSEA